MNHKDYVEHKDIFNHPYKLWKVIDTEFKSDITISLDKYTEVSLKERVKIEIIDLTFLIKNKTKHFEW